MGYRTFYREHTKSMDTYTVTVWNTYSPQPENCKMVIRTTYEASSITEALDKAGIDARKWNAEEPILPATMMTCNGYIRTL